MSKLTRRSRNGSGAESVGLFLSFSYWERQSGERVEREYCVLLLMHWRRRVTTITTVSICWRRRPTTAAAAAPPLLYHCWHRFEWSTHTYIHPYTYAQYSYSGVKAGWIVNNKQKHNDILLFRWQGRLVNKTNTSTHTQGQQSFLYVCTHLFYFFVIAVCACVVVFWAFHHVWWVLRNKKAKSTIYIYIYIYMETDNPYSYLA